MEQAAREMPRPSNSQKVPYLILKFLSHNNQVFLDATEFAFSRAEVRRCIRGTNSIHQNVGTFRWNQAVRAVCVLALRYFLYRDSPRIEECALVGGAGSLAASLDYSIAKNTVWLAEVFGSDGNGSLLVRKLITRQNPERKRPGPVVVAFTKKIADVAFYLNGEEVVDRDTLCRLLGDLDTSERIVKSSRPFSQRPVLLPEVSNADHRHSLLSRETSNTACPYKGLLPFKGGDSSLFFGRENETDHLIETVVRVPFVVVFGPSGVGKSSLISAGLIPRLPSKDAVSLGAEPGWCSTTFRPLGDPTDVLVRNLLGSAYGDTANGSSHQDILKLSGALKTGDAVPLLTALGRNNEPRSYLLVFVDQFEEVFTGCSEESRQAFFQAVHALIEGDPRCRFVCALRSDFFADFLSCGLGHYVEHGTFPLLPMRRDQIKRAIEIPALNRGRRLEEGLVDAILTDAAEEPGALPLVQFVLERLWESCRDQQADITIGSYVALGRLSGALATHADRILKSLSSDQQSKARNLFCRLVRVANDDKDTRDARVSLKLTPDLHEEFGSIVEILTDARLLVSGREPSSMASVVDLSHEAIIKHWATLRAWIAEDRGFLSWRNRISPLISQVCRPDGTIDESFLLRGKLLDDGRFWMARAAERFSSLERKFILTSLTVHKTQEAEKRRLELESSARSLRSANYQHLGAALSSLKSEFPDALEYLTDMSEMAGNEEGRLRFYMARLLYGDQSDCVVSHILQRTLQLPIDSFLSVLDVLRPHQESFTAELWRNLKHEQSEEAQFLKTAAMLSQFDPASSNWMGVSIPLVHCMCREPATTIVPLGPVFRPIRNHLLEPLSKICTEDGEGEARRISAALLIALLGQEEVHLLAHLASVADAGQYPLFFETLNGTPDSLKQANIWWTRRLELMGELSSKELAGTAFNLTRSGSALVGIPALFRRSTDLSPLSEFVGLCVTHGLDYDELWRSIESSSDPKTLYVLLLAIGSGLKPPEKWIENRLPLLVEIYSLNPDAGVHGAVRWLLETWGRSELRKEIDRQLAVTRIDWSRGWFTINVGAVTLTFVIFEGGEGEPRKRFGVAVAPTTREEFACFRNGPELKKYEKYHPYPTCPVVGVSWFDALDFCRWMQESLPNTLGLGIRLPSDSEWDFACRQGTTTDFFFGHNLQHFRLFGWYYANAVSSTKPVATLRPSPWGLFDMHGNVWEWIMDEYTQNGVKLTDFKNEGTVGKGDSRLLRGGAWCDSPTWCRATERSNPHWPTDRNLMFGFRIACDEKHVAS